MFDLKRINGGASKLYPSSASEITKDDLVEMTKDIYVSDHHAIIAVCYESSISKLTMSAFGNAGDLELDVDVLLAKTPDNYDTIHSVGNRVLVTDTVVMQGLHIPIKNKWSKNDVLSAIRQSNKPSESGLIDPNADNPFGLALHMTDTICMVSFKIIPIGVIMASMPVKTTLETTN